MCGMADVLKADLWEYLMVDPLSLSLAAVAAVAGAGSVFKVFRDWILKRNEKDIKIKIGEKVVSFSNVDKIHASKIAEAITREIGGEIKR